MVLVGVKGQLLDQEGEARKLVNRARKLVRDEGKEGPNCAAPLCTFLASVVSLLLSKR